MGIKTTTKETQRGTQGTNTRHGGGDTIRPHNGWSVFLRKIMTTIIEETKL